MALSQPKPFNLFTKTKDELRNLLENYRRKNRFDLMPAVLLECEHRRMRLKYKRYVTWHRAKVLEVMEPFSNISKLVLKSSRTTETEAGGGKLKPLGHPEKLKIDTYTAIKKDGINATFACHVRESWGKPTFVLTIKDATSTVIHMFTVNELGKAEALWAAVAGKAMGGF